MLLSKATVAAQGSGWGVLAYEPRSGRLVVQQVYDHQGNAGQGAIPLLVFDAWEHACYLPTSARASWRRCGRR